MTMHCVTDWSSSSSFTIMYIKIQVDTVLSQFEYIRAYLFPSSILFPRAQPNMFWVISLGDRFSLAKKRRAGVD